MSHRVGGENVCVCVEVEMCVCGGENVCVCVEVETCVEVKCAHLYRVSLTLRYMYMYMYGTES